MKYVFRYILGLFLILPLITLSDNVEGLFSQSLLNDYEYLITFGNQGFMLFAWFFVLIPAGFVLLLVSFIQTFNYIICHFGNETENQEKS